MPDGPADSSAYAITETIHSSSHAVIHRATTPDGRKVIIKTVPEHYGPQHVERLKNEREIGARLDLPSVVRALARETLQGRPALVLEDFGGAALSRSLGSPMDVGHFLRLALAITRGVADIHAKDIVHRDLKPDNILVHPVTGEVKLADFGIASTLPGQRQSAGGVRLIEGSLPYMSPEQTGRTNRALDQRSDLYSLGVTFFEMLTGRLPFHASDPLEWVHCHVARRPPSLATLLPSLPAVPAAIVMRLLAKEPEARYQSARGLARDLERCLGQWQAQARVDDFPIGADDVPDRLQIQQRLYGREQEIAALLAAFERVVRAGAPELVLVSGYSGIGKSALVNELQRPIVRERGLFAAGKFDQYKRDIPYSTFVQAFTELVLEILAQSTQQISEWRKALQDALGINGQLVVDVIPQVALVIGPQPPVPALPPAEAQNRFRLVFRSFIAVFARQEHPLALFLDDLQWADPASLALLKDLILEDASALCLVGAYRDNEVGPSHPLFLTLDEARGAGARISSIVLEPLTRAHLSAFLGDVLHCLPEQAAPLAQLIEEKTGGNPFFALQFLSMLHQERLVEFDRDAGSWRWDMARIRAKGFTDNVVDLMISKLRRLSPAGLEAIQLLACAGTGAEVGLLALAHDLDTDAAHAALAEAVRGGFLVRFGERYDFVHDRIQEAAYSLIPAEERAAVHLRIGRRLVRGLPKESLDDRLFDVVNQLNRGAALIAEPDEQETLFQLNLRAGRKAKQAIAYGSARSYLAQAAAALPPDAWQTRYQDAFTVTLARAECEYLVSAFAVADELFAILLEKVSAKSDRATVCSLRIRRHLLTGEYEKGLAIALEALALFGVTFPESEAEVRAAFMAEAQAIGPNLAGRRIADLVDAPVVTDPEVCATLDLFTEFLPCGYNAGARIFPLVVLKMLNVCLKSGNRETACCAYSVSALILSSFFGDSPSAYEFSEMSLQLNQRLDDPRLRGMLLFVHGGFVGFWRRPFSASPPVFERALKACLEVGDFVYAGYVGCHAIWHALEGGDPLEEVLALSRRYGTIYRQIRSDITCELLRLYDQFIACLQGKTRGTDSFDDDRFSEAACLDLFRKAGAHAGLFIDNLFKAMAHFIYERPAEALAAAGQAEALLGANIGSALEPTFHFFHCLILAAGHGQAPAEGEAQVQVVREKLKKLELWATHCPENYRHRQLLVAGELARMEGKPLEALRLYEQAVAAANQAQAVSVAALAHELAARCARAHGLTWIAEHHLREAHDAYLRWGADGKVRQLEAAFPSLREHHPLLSAGTFTAAPEHLDLLSVIKASQAISGEIVLDQLLTRLVEIVMAQAGASKGYVILRREQPPGETLSIEAEALVTEDGSLAINLLRSLPVSAPLVPFSIINYAWRTRSKVILENAPDSPRFGGDPYIARTRPKSVLCLPILRQAAPVGLLYLENNLVAGAFREDELAVLELLSAQAAISLEHALLLSKEQAARTQAVEALRLREEFLTVASHELRTPMTSLSWTLQTLQGHASAPGTITPVQNANQLVDLAWRQAHRMNRLIRELLEVSRIQSGQLALERRRVDLAALVRDALQRFELDLARAECAVTVQGDGLAVGMWDASRLDQVVENLLSNAMKFGAGKPIEVAISQAPGSARIVVKDLGIGIDPGQHERIFERFGRAVSEAHYGGLGLGLYICRRIVQAHGGTISVVSRPGAGATFTVELPCEETPERAADVGDATARAQ
jgi:predicted ATPase/signal transduction histidine kinase